MANRTAGVALVFVAATLTATHVTAVDGRGTPPQPEGSALFAQGVSDPGFQAQGDLPSTAAKIVNVTGADFVPWTESQSWQILNDGCVASDSLMQARVPLPHGATVTGAWLLVRDASATQQVEIEVNVITRAVSADPTFATLYAYSSGDGATPGYTSPLLTNELIDPTIDKNTEELVIRAILEGDTTNVMVCNVQVRYLVQESGGLEFHEVPPCALFDTRHGSGDFAAKLGSGATITVDAILGSYTPQGGFAGSCDIPPADGSLLNPDEKTRAIAINLVALGANAHGNLKAWKNGIPEPPGGVVIYGPGQNNGNEFALAVQGGLPCGPECLTDGGLFKVKNNGIKAVHVRGVVLGYYTAVELNQY